MKKPRLFWLMMLAFSLVIVLGVCGMLGFFALSIVGALPTREMRESYEQTPRAYAALLADYYVANGQSWAGVERRLSELSFSAPPSFFSYTIIASDGRVIATNDPGGRRGPMIREVEHSAPIVVRGAPVATLVMRPDWRQASSGAQEQEGESSGYRNFWRGFSAAGLALVAGLLLLAIFFAERLSRPLRALTSAAETLAAGRLDVQVPGAPVRELDNLADAFNRMARALGEADRQRRQMTADIAHELRTPLSIIKGRLEGIQDGVYQATPEQVERLLHETALLERLIDDLRLLALAEAGQLPLYPELTGPRALLEGAAAAFGEQAAAQGVALRVEAPDALPPIDVDPQRMAQVLANLVSNALRHTPAGGEITLAAATARAQEGGEHAARPPALPPALADGRQPSVVLTVADTGQGIAPEDLPHIFDRFWRADKARARGSGGAGLGLAIARQIVEAHGGAIAAESEAGGGARISIRLPAAQD